MEIYMTSRTAPPAAVCMPVRGAHLSVVANAPTAAQAHRAWAPARIERVLAPIAFLGQGTSVSFGKRIPSDVQFVTDGARGVPPRGRPV